MEWFLQNHCKTISKQLFIARSQQNKSDVIAHADRLN